MSSFPFEHRLVLVIALVTTILWLLSVYYAAHRGSRLKETKP